MARIFLAMAGLFTCSDILAQKKIARYDIVIYGGTSAGLIAGIEATKQHKSVIIIEPSNRIGGLTTGGLGDTDIGDSQTIGGTAREFYQKIGSAYGKDT